MSAVPSFPVIGTYLSGYGRAWRDATTNNAISLGEYLFIALPYVLALPGQLVNHLGQMLAQVHVENGALCWLGPSVWWQEGEHPHYPNGNVEGEFCQTCWRTRSQEPGAQNRDIGLLYRVYHPHVPTGNFVWYFCTTLCLLRKRVELAAAARDYYRESKRKMQAYIATEVLTEEERTDELDELHRTITDLTEAKATLARLNRELDEKERTANHVNNPYFNLCRCRGCLERQINGYTSEDSDEDGTTNPNSRDTDATTPNESEDEEPPNKKARSGKAERLPNQPTATTSHNSISYSSTDHTPMIAPRTNRPSERRHLPSHRRVPHLLAK